MVEGEFKVQSLEEIDTFNQDLDVGVIRVAGPRLQELGGLSALVRVSTIRNRRRVKSLIRIVRAKTTKPTLAMDEIALQYDDRLELGIKSVGERHELSIKRVRQWPALPCFLLLHTSPLIKKEAAFAIALLFVGFLLGFLVPSDGWCYGSGNRAVLPRERR